MTAPEPPLWTRRQYLATLAIYDGASFTLAREAVASVALAHPEWDMDEARTWQEWEALDREAKRRGGRHRRPRPRRGATGE